MAQASTDEPTPDVQRIDTRTNAEIAYREGASFATVLMMITPDDLTPTQIEVPNGQIVRYADWLYDLRHDLNRALDFFRDG